MLNNKSKPVTKKVKAGIQGGVAGGLIAIISSWVMKEFFQVTVPLEIAVTFGSLLSIGFGFAGSCLKKD